MFFFSGGRWVPGGKHSLATPTYTILLLAGSALKLNVLSHREKKKNEKLTSGIVLKRRKMMFKKGLKKIKSPPWARTFFFLNPAPFDSARPI